MLLRRQVIRQKGGSAECTENTEFRCPRAKISSSSAAQRAAPRRGRKGKAPLRAEPPALPVLAEESDLFDGGEADVLREDITNSVELFYNYSHY